MDEDNDTSFRGATEGSNIRSKWVTGTSQYDQFRVQSAGYRVIGDVVAGLSQFFVFAKGYIGQEFCQILRYVFSQFKQYLYCCICIVFAFIEVQLKCVVVKL